MIELCGQADPRMMFICGISIGIALGLFLLD